MPKKSCLLLLLAVSIAFGEETWFPFRFEYTHGTQTEMGLSSGVWWSPHVDGIPLDAYGPTLGVMAFRNKQDVLPGVQLGLEANMLFLCARMQCGFYKAKDNSALTIFCPQAGLTWLSIVNFYAGYSKRLSGPSQTAVDEVNLSFCLNLPSYFFRGYQRNGTVRRE